MWQSNRAIIWYIFNDNDKVKDGSSIKEQEFENYISFEIDDLLDNKDDKEYVDIIKENGDNLEKSKNEVFNIDAKYVKKKKGSNFYLFK